MVMVDWIKKPFTLDVKTMSGDGHGTIFASGFPPASSS
jgi:hypothetical protein